MGQVLAMERDKQKVINRIDQMFSEKKDILSIYYTAGFPNLDDTIKIASCLEQSGADMLEIGIPFSDPVADGPTIQASSKQALVNGMTLSLLFDQLKELRDEVSIPVLLMGYMNPILQFGVEQFCKKCVEVGIDGTILPDLPLQEFDDHFTTYFELYGLANISLISPNTSKERIELIDSRSNGFIYMVSSASVTGAKSGVQEGQLNYYQRVKEMNLNSSKLIGFGISDKESFENACAYAEGAIVGSAFINQLTEDSSFEGIQSFIHSIKN